MLNLFQPPAGLLGDQEEAIRQQMQMQGLLGLAAGLFEAGTPSRTPVSLGGSAIRGLMAGQQMAKQTLTNALQMQELARKRQEQEEIRKRQEQFRQAIEGSMTTRVSPTMGLGAEQVASPITQAELEAFGPQAYMEAARTAAPTERVVDRDRLLNAIAQFAPEKYLELTQPQKSDFPASIKEYQYAVNQGFKGTFEDYQTQMKKAGATNIVMPGDKKMAEALGTKGAERLDSSLTAAQEAQSTLQNISDLRPILAQGVFSGPLSAAPRAVAQIASQLGVTGKDTTELLQRTAVAMQGLAKFELSAAAAMRGQGAITENERMLIQRAAAGRLDQFTAPEVQSLLTAMEKTANYRIASHNRQLDVLRKSSSPEIREMLPFYELQSLPMAPTRPAGVRKFNPVTGRVE